MSPCRLAFELMITMGYDAMAIGNHEFEYGHEVFAWQKSRVPFPVLGANFFYKDTDHPYAQAHAIIERNGIRIGVIGIMGQDAVTAIIPSYIAPLDVRSPANAVKKSVDELRDRVDLIVLLTHQGKTAPMQTDAESDPRLQRDIDADIALAGAVKGIDVLFAGHADIGFIHGGSLRKDIPAGDVRVVDLLDTYPFVDDVIIKEMSGDQIRRALEQSLTFERGLLQLSGLELTYDLQRPEWQRIVSLSHKGEPVMADDQYTIAAPGFLTEGGDLYDSFPESPVIGNIGKVSDIAIGYFREQEVVRVPDRGRQLDVTPALD